MKPPGLLALVLAVLAVLAAVLALAFVLVALFEKKEKYERALGASKVCTAGEYGPPTLRPTKTAR